MARRRKSKSRVLNLTARSETRKGFTMPKISSIKSALRKRSKTFLISLIMSMFSKLSKTQKISVLIKIDRRSIGKIIRKRKAIKRKRRSTKRKSTKRKTKRKSKNGRRRTTIR